MPSAFKITRIRGLSAFRVQTEDSRDAAKAGVARSLRWLRNPGTHPKA